MCSNTKLHSIFEYRYDVVAPNGSSIRAGCIAAALEGVFSVRFAAGVSLTWMRGQIDVTLTECSTNGSPPLTFTLLLYWPAPFSITTFRFTSESYAPCRPSPTVTYDLHCI